MVVAPQPDAVEEGVSVLKNGGNAVDAALTAALVQGVVDPQMCGVGGFGSFLCYHKASGEFHQIDFHGKAPYLAEPDMWEKLFLGECPDAFGYVLEGQVNDVGYRSITTPGVVAGFRDTLSRFGTLKWRALFEPAIRSARDGFIVRPALRHWWERKALFGRAGTRERLTHTPDARALYFRDGSLYEEGETFVNDDLARTLSLLAEEGPDYFYSGPLADAMVNDIEANGGLLRHHDLRDYVPTHTRPLKGEYRGFSVHTSPPPGGGITLLEILNILEGYPLGEMEHNSPQYISLVSRAMRAAFADRAQFVGDPGFVEVPVEKLISREHAAEIKAQLDAGHDFTVPVSRFYEPPDTTHISVLDGEGNAVALTHSLGMSSGVISPGLGFIYNNCMNAFDPTPGGVNSIQPGKSRVTGVAPTIICKGGKPYFIVGAPGGTRIITSVLQAILNVIDFGMSAQDAVSAPRFDCQREIIYLQARIPDSTRRALEEMGHRTERSFLSYGGFGLVHGILTDPEEGILQGGADPAGDGMPLKI
jgi:gamma-glutamyltranspeptidase/glutathione hydrolase